MATCRRGMVWSWECCPARSLVSCGRRPSMLWPKSQGVLEEVGSAVRCGALQRRGELGRLYVGQEDRQRGKRNCDCHTDYRQATDNRREPNHLSQLISYSVPHLRAPSSQRPCAVAGRLLIPRRLPSTGSGERLLWTARCRI